MTINDSYAIETLESRFFTTQEALLVKQERQRWQYCRDGWQRL